MRDKEATAVFYERNMESSRRLINTADTSKVTVNDRRNYVNTRSNNTNSKEKTVITGKNHKRQLVKTTKNEKSEIIAANGQKEQDAVINVRKKKSLGNLMGNSKATEKNEDINLEGLKIIPLGGLEKIGMNITAIEYEDSIIVIDCGLSFPEDEMLGIDFIIPDVTYLKDNIEKVKGFVITHGHEDHIGALPYVLKEINVPIYATKLTMAIIENKLKEHNLIKGTKRKVVKYGQSINLGCFRIEFIRTNHSIADAAALAIYTRQE